jgi:hypothetical protein
LRSGLQDCDAYSGTTSPANKSILMDNEERIRQRVQEFREQQGKPEGHESER